MWQLWRQDDHGGRYLIREFPAWEQAQAELELLEGRGHKQLYWLRRSDEADPIPPSKGSAPGSPKTSR